MYAANLEFFLRTKKFYLSFLLKKLQNVEVQSFATGKINDAYLSIYQDFCKSYHNVFYYTYKRFLFLSIFQRENNSYLADFPTSLSSCKDYFS